MVANIPSELVMCLEIEFNANESPRHWLHIRFQLKTWELVDLVQNSLSQLWKPDYFSDLLGVHLIKVMPLELCFLFNLSSNLLHVGHLSKLSERSH